MITDIAGLVEEARAAGVSGDALARLANGMPELTKLAEKYMHAFEEDVFVGRAWQTVDNVVGSVPNVPALLAGVPNSMRMRRRTTSHTAPLTILLELTGSSGVLDTRAERGAAMLAMVRLLINTRPVELWALTTYGETNRMDMVATRIDVSPLDLGRSAALLCDNVTLSTVTRVVSRRLRNGGTWLGGWSYGSADLERKWSGEAFRQLMSPSSELLFVPAAYLLDESVADPEKWMRDMLVKYGMGAVVRGDDAA
jgi:hypothetical protein